MNHYEAKQEAQQYRLSAFWFYRPILPLQGCRLYRPPFVFYKANVREPDGWGTSDCSWIVPGSLDPTHD